LPVSRCSSSRGTNSSRAPIGDRPEGGDDRRRDEVAGQVELAPAGRDDAVAGSLLARGDVARDGRLVDHRAGERAAGVRQPAGSSIAVVATDAPLAPAQLTRLARRAGLGLGRSGSVATTAAARSSSRRPPPAAGRATSSDPPGTRCPTRSSTRCSPPRSTRARRRTSTHALRGARRQRPRGPRCARAPARCGARAGSRSWTNGASHREPVIRPVAIKARKFPADRIALS
jgi:hypothetical protein